MGAMTALEVEIDAAFEAFTHARENDDPSNEAVALTRLSQALEESNRSGEAADVHKQALAVACDSAVRYAQAQLLMKRGLAQATTATLGSYEADYAWNAFRRAAEFYSLAEASDDAERARSEASRMGRLSKPHGPIHGIGDVQIIAAGFVALKVVGPFLEAFSKKLGEQLGESTARAISRIKLIHRSGEERPLSEEQEARANELIVEFDPRCPNCRGTGTTPSGRPCGPCNLVLKRIDLHPGEFRRVKVKRLTIDTQPTTTLILPDSLSDEAKLAIIELDVTADGVCGRTLTWDEATGTWTTDRDPDAIF
jgi:hypothetical protein